MAASASAERTRRIDLGRITLEVVEAGEGRPILFLHGFPECAAAWSPVAAALPGFRSIMPNQRGYGGSARPAGTAAYAISELVEDVAELLRACAAVPVTVAGHDWGGVVAAWLAARHPALVERLILANGPHPAAFQEALLDDPAQRAASSYIEALRTPGAAERLAEGGPEAMWDRMFGGDPAMAGRRVAYVSAWSPPGAVEAMVEWYRAAPFVLPSALGARRPAWLGEDLIVRVPVLAIWGERDPVLLPSLPDRFAKWCPDLHIARIPDAGHGVIHQCPARVAQLIEEFIGP